MPQLKTIHKEADNLKLLESFKHFNDNWNGYGAKSFDHIFIERVKEIVSGLHSSPKIFPTGRNSIQLAYEKDNGDYLEFEIYETEEINCFQIIDGSEKEERIDVWEMNSLIKKFHARH